MTPVTSGNEHAFHQEDYRLSTAFVQHASSVRDLVKKFAVRLPLTQLVTRDIDTFKSRADDWMLRHSLRLGVVDKPVV